MIPSLKLSPASVRRLAPRAVRKNVSKGVIGTALNRRRPTVVRRLPPLRARACQKRQTTDSSQPLIASQPRKPNWAPQTVQYVRDLVSEIWSWCQLCVPLAAFACFTALFRGALTDPTQSLASPPSPAVYASVSSSVRDSRYSWTDVVQYRFQKIMSMQMFGKLFAVLMAATPIVLVGGYSYKIVTGRNLNAALFKVYSVMSSIPGASAVEADNSAGLFLCSLVFFAGTFTVAVTLGIICDDISNIVATVRNGNYQIIEDEHMVILNVNERLRPVLSQIAEASKERGSFRCPIVILDDRDKEELDWMVSQAAEGLNLNLLTRNGCTHDVMDLKRVAAGRAKCIIWLEPDGNEISVAARRASAIASLKTLGTGEDRPARMIVQTSQDSVKSKKQLTNVPLAFRSPPLKETSKFNVVEVYEEENLDRFLAQCALQPHLSDIMSDVFQHNEGKEFYVTKKTDFGGKTFATARRHFYNAVVCGIYTPLTNGTYKHGKVQLNPPEDTVLRNEDELVVLCGDLWHTEPSSKPLPAPPDWVQNVEGHRSTYCSEHVVVLCFGEEGFADSGLIEALGRFASRSTKVTIVAKKNEEKMRNSGKCQLSYIEGNPSSFQTLRRLRRRKVDSVVLAGLEDLPPRVADAQLISSLIQIQEVANVHWEDKSGFNVVSPVNFPETELVAEHIVKQGNEELDVPITLDMILPTNLSSGVLVQVAGYPQLDMVFKEILSESGSELYIRNMDEYDLAGRGLVKFYEVSEIARKFGETFLGVLKEDQTFIIAPEALSEREYTANEKIVVLAAGPHVETNQDATAKP